MDTNRLTGHEHKDEFLEEMGFSSIEIARVQAIRSRPRATAHHYTIPRLYSEYKTWQKQCFAEVFGDAAAEAIWGNGPWLRKQLRLAYEAKAKRNCLDSSIQADHKRQDNSTDLQPDSDLYSPIERG